MDSYLICELGGCVLGCRRGVREMGLRRVKERAKKFIAGCHLGSAYGHGRIAGRMPSASG